MAAVLCFAAGHAVNARADTLLVVGDSLSAAHGIERDAGWVNLLRQRLDSQHQVINASISGDTTSSGAARLPELLERHAPDVVLLELGGNDGLRGLSPQQMKLNLRDMIEKSQAADARVLLLGIEIPPNYGASYTDAFRGVFRQLSEEYALPLVPFILDGIALQDTMMQDDGIHPTAEAQPTILDNVWPELKVLLSDDADKPKSSRCLQTIATDAGAGAFCECAFPGT
ncbi:arylesterase [Chromohalobacter sp. 48-RD10]|uniref:arylesterase n=1 Tax=Chromohalobacter sp. 48-RD10 TaxID=2994063 RepID=UPI002468879C|nr:arylesterase [Chromohalobacter sp. 48-RD10]